MNYTMIISIFYHIPWCRLKMVNCYEKVHGMKMWPVGGHWIIMKSNDIKNFHLYNDALVWLIWSVNLKSELNGVNLLTSFWIQLYPIMKFRWASISLDIYESNCGRMSLHELELYNRHVNEYIRVFILLFCPIINEQERGVAIE